MNNDEYDPEQDPIYLQRQTILNLEIIIEKLITIEKLNERQADSQYSISEKLSAINGNIMFIGVALIIIGVIMVFK